MAIRLSTVLAAALAVVACSSSEETGPQPDEVRVLPPIEGTQEEPSEEKASDGSKSEEDAAKKDASPSDGEEPTSEPSSRDAPSERSSPDASPSSNSAAPSSSEGEVTIDDGGTADGGAGGKQSQARSARSTAKAASASSRGASDRPRMVVDAMVGQVNGKPVYASSIFEEIGREQLNRLGKSLTRAEFRKRAAQLIQSTLKEKVTNSLMLAKAENSLTEKEKKGLRRIMKKERKKLLAKYKGVESSAERQLRKAKGHGLQKAIENRRDELLVQKYLREEIQPKINVTNADVRRYYSDHYEEFNPPAKVVLRMILVTDEKAAKRVEKALSEGKPFKKVAKQYSQVNPKGGGKMGPYKTKLSAFSELRWSDLNKAVQSLEVGEVSSRVSVELGYAWVKLIQVKKGESQPLEAVYLEIENKLRQQQFNRLSQQYMSRMLKEGNFTPLKEMVRSLLTVAMNRFAKAAETGSGSTGSGSAQR